MSLPVLPSRLHPGDTIAVIYPAGPVRDQARLANGLQVLRDLNLRIRHYPLDGSGPEYLAADDEQRIQNLYRLWNDEEVKALIAARGLWLSAHHRKDEPGSASLPAQMADRFQRPHCFAEWNFCRNWLGHAARTYGDHLGRY